MKKIPKEQLAKNMDALSCGSPSIDEIEVIAKSRGASSIKYIATVGFLDPCDVKIFFAETKEDMAAQIEQAANGREYVARYSGMCFTSNQTSASIEDAAHQDIR